MEIWILIICMAATTFATRYAFLSRGLKMHLNEKWQTLLGFTVPALLTAFWAPMVFAKQQPSGEIFQSPELLAGIFTIIISLLVRHTLLTVLLGMGCYYAIQYDLQRIEHLVKVVS